MGNGRSAIGLRAGATAALACGFIAAGAATPAMADPIFFNTMTRTAEADFDFDGPLDSTAGSLGVATASATLLAADLPAELLAAGVTSITLGVSASGGFISADQGNMVEPRGLGVYSAADDGASVPATNESNLNPDETLTLTISSTGIQEVRIVGLRFGAFRNYHPVSQATLSGATANGGDTVITGNNPVAPFDGDGNLIFDSPVSTVTLGSNSAGSNNGFRLSGIVVAVPEPSTAALMGVAALAMLRTARRRAE